MFEISDRYPVLHHSSRLIRWWDKRKKTPGQTDVRRGREFISVINAKRTPVRCGQIMRATWDRDLPGTSN
jgi:hypothetical protein